MQCPVCKHDDTAVIDSRVSEEGKAVRRRRECPKCEHRFTTFERQETTLIVIKRDGTREPYIRSKIERGVWLACTKRPVTQEQVDKMLSHLEERWVSIGPEVPTSTLGEDLMKELKKLDQVAYIRYASIHREFTDVEEFKEEISKLWAKKEAKK